MEYCADWYAPDAYSKMPDGAIDPKGPAGGEEHVVRGGAFTDDASVLRSAARSHTRHKEWPQNRSAAAAEYLVVFGYPCDRFPCRV